MGANFGANFGENFGNFVSNFTTFFGNFVQQKGGANAFLPHTSQCEIAFSEAMSAKKQSFADSFFSGARNASLNIGGTQAGTKRQVSKLKKLAICFDTPLSAAKETPKRVPKQTGTKMPSFQRSKACHFDTPSVYKTCHFDTPSVLVPLWLLAFAEPSPH